MRLTIIMLALVLTAITAAARPSARLLAQMARNQAAEDRLQIELVHRNTMREITRIYGGSMAPLKHRSR